MVTFALGLFFLLFASVLLLIIAFGVAIGLLYDSEMIGPTLFFVGPVTVAVLLISLELLGWAEFGLVP